MDPNSVINNIISTSADANDVLAAIKDVQQFYQDSFANLLWVMGTIITLIIFVLGGVVGVIMPIVLQRWQSRSFTEKEQDILKKFRKEIEETKDKMKSEMELQVTEVKKELTEENKKLKKEAEENILSLEIDMLVSQTGITALTSANMYIIFYLSLKAALKSAQLVDHARLNKTIRDAEKVTSDLQQYLNTLPYQVKERIVNDSLRACSLISDELQAKEFDIAYLRRVIAIEDTLHSIQIKPKTSE